ncbi:unnamed protein product [Cuscuta campestris]|uniref:Uncharacterized protein n=1 Tax=Cuscuta campestris TaxID=132261 RepID=A0A484LWB3_9ASTE|nr:unnamed protein product [Cuscuta campestris]
MTLDFNRGYPHRPEVVRVDCSGGGYEPSVWRWRAVAGPAAVMDLGGLISLWRPCGRATAEANPENNGCRGRTYWTANT